MLPRALPILTLCGALAACGDPATQRDAYLEGQRTERLEGADTRLTSSVFDLFGDRGEDVRIGVNRYLWAAALDTLSILPIEAADPFSGVIATSWGRVNGAATPYRMTVYVTQPALDARSLRVAVFRQQGGRAVAVSDEIARTVENAILTRARQLRVAELERGR